MKTYIQAGNSMTFTAPVGGVVSGTPYKIGQLLVVAVVNASEGESFAGQAVGVFALPKNAAQALTEGALVYWDNTSGEVTTTATGNLLIGVAAEDALAATTTAPIRLNGIGRPDEA